MKGLARFGVVSAMTAAIVATWAVASLALIPPVKVIAGRG